VSMVGIADHIRRPPRAANPVDGILTSACAVNRPTGRPVTGTHTRPEACGEKSDPLRCWGGAADERGSGVGRLQAVRRVGR
jgi:hypothetical protein